jgi:hypothetical protein
MDRDVHLFARLHRLQRPSAVTAALVFAAVLAVAIGTGTATGAMKTVVLGAAAPATPSCPEACQAIGKTTGFQTSIGKTQDPFAAPAAGRIVAWSLKLAAPNEKQMTFFEDFFGGPPQARIAVLKPIKKRIKAGKMVYKLKSQGPVEDLKPFLGTTTTFTMEQPLVVRTGQIVALSVPTWAPAFAVNLGNKTAWRASRKNTKCNKPDDIKLGTAHQAIGQDRLYGCTYKTARLLYSATLVQDPTVAPPKKKPTS